MISIFYRPSYLGNRYFKDQSNLVLQRVSSQVRGVEMAEYLGAKLNPTEYGEDVCIHVKPYSLNEVRDGDWVDFLDGGRIFNMLKERPKVNIIAASQRSYEFLKNELPNMVVFIPQHHINNEEFIRKPNSVRVAGYIGAASPEAVRICEETEGNLKKIGYKFISCLYFKTRQDSIDFYKSIDVLVIPVFSPDFNPHKIPTKIINAASYGVPTIAFPLQGYKEIDGFYLPATNMGEVVLWANNLKNKTFYEEWSVKVLQMSGPYHISRIAELYNKL